MNNQPDRKVHDLVTELAQHFDEDPLTDADIAAYQNSSEDAESDRVDDLVGAMLEAAAFDAMSQDARALLMMLTDETESLEPQTRARLVDAANRALQYRRHAISPLPVLLFVTRRAQAKPLEDIATQISVADAQLRAVESGADDLRTLTPRQVADWISSVDIDRTQAEQSLRRTFISHAATGRAAGHARLRHIPDTATDSDRFIRDVMNELSKPRG